jgi:hypothetical protein
MLFSFSKVYFSSWSRIGEDTQLLFLTSELFLNALKKQGTNCGLHNNVKSP